MSLALIIDWVGQKSVVNGNSLGQVIKPRFHMLALTCVSVGPLTAIGMYNMMCPKSRFRLSELLKN